MRRRSSSQDSLQLEGDPSCGDDEACESYSSNDAEREAWRGAATSVNPEQVLIMSVESRRSLSRRIARDAIEFACVNRRGEQCKYGAHCRLESENRVALQRRLRAASAHLVSHLSLVATPFPAPRPFPSLRPVSTSLSLRVESAFVGRRTQVLATSKTPPSKVALIARGPLQVGPSVWTPAAVPPRFNLAPEEVDV